MTSEQPQPSEGHVPTDGLSLMLRSPASRVGTWAADAGVSSQAILGVGLALCAVAFPLFWLGHYWLGLAATFLFVLLDIVASPLSTAEEPPKWRGVADQGVHILVPPLWLWAWKSGLDDYGTPLEPVYGFMVLAATVLGYVSLLAIESSFRKRHGMDIHAWRPIDTRFRLISAQRNIYLVILAVSLLLARPDVGLELVALWTIVTVIFLSARLAQANRLSDLGRPVTSWIA